MGKGLGMIDGKILRTISLPDNLHVKGPLFSSTAKGGGQVKHALWRCRCINPLYI